MLKTYTNCFLNKNTLSQLGCSLFQNGRKKDNLQDFFEFNGEKENLQLFCYDKSMATYSQKMSTFMMF